MSTLVRSWYYYIDYTTGKVRFSKFFRFFFNLNWFGLNTYNPILVHKDLSNLQYGENQKLPNGTLNDKKKKGKYNKHLKIYDDSEPVSSKKLYLSSSIVTLIMIYIIAKIFGYID